MGSSMSHFGRIYNETEIGRVSHLEDTGLTRKRAGQHQDDRPIGSKRKPGIPGNPKSNTPVLSLTARRAALLTEPTAREAVRRYTDWKPGCR